MSRTTGRTARRARQPTLGTSSSPRQVTDARVATRPPPTASAARCVAGASTGSPSAGPTGSDARPHERRPHDRRRRSAAAPTGGRARQGLRRGRHRGARPRRRHRRLRQAGRFTAIMGPSGSGKSTLMHCVAGLDTLTSGQVFIGDVDLTALSDKELTLLRRDRIGFVFQAFNLIPTLDAPGEHHPAARPRRRARPTRRGSTRSSSTVGLGDRLKHRPVGALRRPAAARRRGPGPGQPARRSSSPTSPPATSTRAPAPRSSSFMRQAVRDLGQTIVMVTHDPVAAVLRRPRPVPRRRPDRRRDGGSDGREGARPHEGASARLSVHRARSPSASLWAHKRRLISTVLAIVLGVAFMAGHLRAHRHLDKVFDDLFADVNEERRRRGAGRGHSSSDRSAATPRDRSTRALVDRGRRRRRRRRGRAVRQHDRHRRHQPRARRRRRAARQRRPAHAPRVAGSTTRRSTPTTSPRAAARRPTTRWRSTSAAAEDGDLVVGDTVTVLTQLGEPTVHARRHRSPSASEDALGGVVSADFTLRRGPAPRRRRRPGRQHRRRGRRRRLPGGARRPHRGAVARERPRSSPARRRPSRRRLRRAAGLRLLPHDPAASSPASPCSSAPSSSPTPSPSSWPSAPGSWPCCGPSAPAAARCSARCCSRPCVVGLVAARARPRRRRRCSAVGVHRRCSAAAASTCPSRRSWSCAPHRRHRAGRRAWSSPCSPSVVPAIAGHPGAAAGRPARRGHRPVRRARRSGSSSASSCSCSASFNLVRGLGGDGDDQLVPAVGSARCLLARRRHRHRSGPRRPDASGCSAAGCPASRGITGRLATENAARSPKRTSATASALIIGVGARRLHHRLRRLGQGVGRPSQVERGFAGDLVVQAESRAFALAGFPAAVAGEVAGEVAGVEPSAAGRLRPRRSRPTPTASTGHRLPRRRRPGDVRPGARARDGRRARSPTSRDGGHRRSTARSPRTTTSPIGDHVVLTVPGGQMATLEVAGASATTPTCSAAARMTRADFGELGRAERLDFQVFASRRRRRRRRPVSGRRRERGRRRSRAIEVLDRDEFRDSHRRPDHRVPQPHLRPARPVDHHRRSSASPTRCRCRSTSAPGSSACCGPWA